MEEVANSVLDQMQDFTVVTEAGAQADLSTRPRSNILAGDADTSPQYASLNDQQSVHVRTEGAALAEADWFAKIATSEAALQLQRPETPQVSSRHWVTVYLVCAAQGCVALPFMVALGGRSLQPPG